MTGKKAVAVAARAGFIAAVLLLAVLLIITGRPTSVHGAVVAGNADPAKQLPITDAEVSVEGWPLVRPVRSDTSGFFNIPLAWRMAPGARIMLHFRHPDYQPLDLEVAGDKLCIAHLTRIVQPASATSPQVKITNIVVRYSVQATTAINIGSVVKTFEVINIGDVPCRGHRPCSPDGKWKAAAGSTTIDAGLGNEFHNARASCIAGPCPFTRIEENDLNARDSRILRVSALNWSDTATFLVEAEVYKPMVSGALRHSYPLVFDRALTFTLPGTADGVSIQAEVNGTTIVFPLGPALFLSWANCQVLVNKDQTKVYRCELKPGFRFS